jgi:hypothetical protein
MNNPAVLKIQKYFTQLHFLSILISLLLILVFVRQSNSQINQEPKIFGVTVDAVGNLSSIVTSLSNHQKKMTTRIVFDEWIPAFEYINAVNQIHNVSYIMGEILDSYYMNQYDTAQYRQRVNDYINTLGTKVDLWEIGNEVNGEWLGSIPEVINKINIAYNLVKQRKNIRLTSITLYYNKNCWENPQNEMFRWVNEQLPMKMRYGLDYVWVSYYEDDCNNYQPNWQQVFDSLHVLFPNSKLGIGECGTVKSAKKASYIKRYYKMNITTPNYAGGYFWWYYKQDCVPWTKPLWATLDSAIGDTQPLNTKNEQIELSNYPNPFNPTTKINFSLVVTSDVKLNVFDASGKLVTTLVNGIMQRGNNSVSFDAANLSSGIYFYQISIINAQLSININETRKMILVK